jgi:hypothetical protein
MRYHSVGCGMPDPHARNFGAFVLKSSANVNDADSATKIASAVCQAFTQQMCRFCAPHGNDFFSLRVQTSHLN